MKRLILCAAMLAASAAQAAFFDGNGLLDMYGKHPQEAGAYVVGIADGTEDQRCMPSGITGQQVADIVQKALVALPEYRHYTARQFVSVTLNAVFPCPKKAPAKGSLDGRV